MIDIDNTKNAADDKNNSLPNHDTDKKKSDKGSKVRKVKCKKSNGGKVQKCAKAANRPVQHLKISHTSYKPDALSPQNDTNTMRLPKRWMIKLLKVSVHLQRIKYKLKVMRLKNCEI